MLSPELSSHVFSSLLRPSLLESPQSITMPHYLAFEAFFFHINYLLRKVNGTGCEDIVVSCPDFSLEGVDCLWRIALECRGQQVSSAAIALLNALHDNLSDEFSSIGNTQQQRERYIATCIAHLSQYARDRDWQRGLRCLQLLHNMLDANDRKGQGGRARSHACSTRGRRLRFVVQNNIKGSREAKRGRLEVVAHANDTLFSLRANIASALALPVDSFRLITSGKPLTAEHFPLLLHQLHCKDGQTILVTKKSAGSQRADLLDGRGDATPGFKQALSLIFARFACNKDEQSAFLSTADFASYILACGAGENSAGEDRIRQIFEKHGEVLTVKQEEAKEEQPVPAGDEDAAVTVEEGEDEDAVPPINADAAPDSEPAASQPVVAEPDDVSSAEHTTADEGREGEGALQQAETAGEEQTDGADSDKENQPAVNNAAKPSQAAGVQPAVVVSTVPSPPSASSEEEAVAVPADGDAQSAQSGWDKRKQLPAPPRCLRCQRGGRSGGRGRRRGRRRTASSRQPQQQQRTRRTTATRTVSTQAPRTTT